METKKLATKCFCQEKYLTTIKRKNYEAIAIMILIAMIIATLISGFVGFCLFIAGDEITTTTYYSLIVLTIFETIIMCGLAYSEEQFTDEYVIINKKKHNGEEKDRY